MRINKQLQLGLFLSALVLSPETTPLVNQAFAYDIEDYAREDKSVVISQALTIEDLSFCQTPGVTCSNLSADPLEVTVRCDGGEDAEIVENGGWEALGSEATACWNTLTVCYYGNCQNWDQGSVDNSPPDINVTFSSYAHDNSFSKCLTDQETPSKANDGANKEYCLWDYDASTEFSDSDDYMEKRADGIIDQQSSFDITGNTGDDMLTIAEGTSGFIEYLDIGDHNSNGLKWIKRDTNAFSPNQMMIPIGPKEGYDDYLNFLKNSPPGIEIKNACYPVKVSLGCSNWNPSSMCGSYALANFLFKPVDNDDNNGLCLSGTPSAVTLDDADGLNYSWTCE